MFLVLVILMFLIKSFTAVMSASEKRTVKAVPAAAAAGVPARGSVGGNKNVRRARPDGGNDHGYSRG